MAQPSKEWTAYDEAMQRAQADLDAALLPALDALASAHRHAAAVRDAIIAQAQLDYELACAPTNADAEAAHTAARKEYDAAVAPHLAAYIASAPAADTGVHRAPGA